jgi:hypothetical protein|tara:strand:- start:5127 stop:5354 length:228 start_codon:yes stop_codon:yes gene_type:complete
MLKPGDLVEEIIPLAAGDAPARMGILVKQSFPLFIKIVTEEEKYRGGTVKVLFGDKIELMPYTYVRKVETFSGNK